MTEREMKKLSRLELLEILLAQGREIERLRAEIDALEQRLAQEPRPVAPVREQTAEPVQAVFAPAATDTAADTAAVSETLTRARQLLAQAEALSGETQELCRELQSRTEEECAAAKEEAKRKAKAYWNEVSSWVREGAATGQWDQRT